MLGLYEARLLYLRHLHIDTFPPGHGPPRRSSKPGEGQVTGTMSHFSVVQQQHAWIP